MKGQSLFIRPIETADLAAVSAFLHQHGGGSADVGSGILAKLVGDLAAVLTFRISESNLVIHQLRVREDLRRKRIGTLMLDELERTAASEGLQSLSVRKGTGADAFLVKAGFVDEGDSMVKKVLRAAR